MDDSVRYLEYPCPVCDSTVIVMWDTPDGGTIHKCHCGWRFAKALNVHPWDERYGHVYIGLKQYKEKYV